MPANCRLALGSIFLLIFSIFHAFFLEAGQEASAKADMPPVQWPSEKSLDASVLQVLSAPSLRALSEAPVPVLLPKSLELSAEAILLSGPHWYAASISRGDYSIAINAMQVAPQAPPGLAGAPRPRNNTSKVRGRGATLSMSEGVWSLTWQEYGAAYLVRVRCASERDERCADSKYIVDLANSLVFVGGRP